MKIKTTANKYEMLATVAYLQDRLLDGLYVTTADETIGTMDEYLQSVGEMLASQLPDDFELRVALDLDDEDEDDGR